MSTKTENTADLTVDASPELDVKTFDVASWIGGTTGTVRAVTLYQRPDLLGEIEAVERELRIAQNVSDEDRSMGEAGPQALQRQLEDLHRDFEASGATFKLKGTSDGHRDRIKSTLKKRGITDAEIVQRHLLVDAITEPAGVTVELLEQLQENAEAQYKLLLVTFGMANFQPPQADLPFSSGTSDSRKRGRSS